MPLHSCCRVLRSQQFISHTAADIAAREAKAVCAVEAYWAAHPRRTVPRERIDGFIARLATDAERRTANRCVEQCSIHFMQLLMATAMRDII